MKIVDFKLGGHPLRSDDLIMIQTSYKEAFKALISVFDPALNTILSGFVITDDGTTVSCTSGYVSWQGEVFSIPSTSFSKVVGGNLFLALVETVLYPSPVTYKDETIQTVHIDRTLQLKYYNSGDVGEYYAAFTRTSSIGFKRGMVLDFVGNISTNFDDTGLGINDLAGFAACNGNTFTISGGVPYTVPDKRGRKSVGATNIPATGAPTYDTNLGTYPLTATGGAKTILINKANLPNYNLNVTDPGHDHPNFYHPFVRDVRGGGNNDIIFEDTDKTYNRTNNADPGKPFVGFNTTGIIVNSGGSGSALDISNPYWAGIPIIKL